LGAALALALLGAVGFSAPGRLAASSNAAELMARTQAALARLEASEQKVLAFCDLAAKAAPDFPQMAADFYGEALATAGDASRAQALTLAGKLKEQAKARPAAAESAPALAAARDLEARAWAAWPLRLLAEGLLPLNPPKAAAVLGVGLERCAQNPDPYYRDMDRAGLALVLARRDSASARRQMDLIGEARIRAWAFRELARLSQARGDLAKAVQAGERIADPGAQAMSLAATARLYFQVDQKAGSALGRRAFDLAGRIEDRKRRSFVQGEVAALISFFDPLAAEGMAGRLGPLDGSGFKAWRGLGAVMGGADPAERRSFMAKALSQAESLPLAYERHKALALLAGDWAAWRIAPAGKVEMALPRFRYYLRGEAEAAMVLAQAGVSLNKALAEAADISERTCRVLTQARLAAILLKVKPLEGLSLAEQVLQSAGGAEGSLVRAVLAPAAVEVDAGRAALWASGIAEEGLRVRVLVKIAAKMAQNGDRAGAEGVLELALKTINSMKRKQTLDKVRLLGHMGREWIKLETDRAREFFELGARSARELG